MRDGPSALSIDQIGLGDQQPNQMAIDGKKVYERREFTPSPNSPKKRPVVGFPEQGGVLGFPVEQAQFCGHSEAVQGHCGPKTSERKWLEGRKPSKKWKIEVVNE
jgi:hypothetical protein